jgi:hypothetical protein
MVAKKAYLRNFICSVLPTTHFTMLDTPGRYKTSHYKQLMAYSLK